MQFSKISSSLKYMHHYLVKILLLLNIRKIYSTSIVKSTCELYTVINCIIIG